MIERANQVAGASQPQPIQSPIAAAAMTAVLVAVVLALFEMWDDFLGRRWAELVVIVISASVSFLDCRQKWNLHAKAFQNAIDRLRTPE